MYLDTKYWLFGIITLLVLISACTQSENYTIDGNSVYVNDSNVYINVYPHTTTGTEYVNVEFESKLFTGDIDFVFGFDKNSVVPSNLQIYNPHDVELNYTCEYEFNYTTNPNYFTCYRTYANGTTEILKENSFTHGDLGSKTAYWDETINWSNWNPGNVINHNAYDMTTWYYAQNKHINAGDMYKLRFKLNVPKEAQKGKYSLAVKPSSETIQEAIQNNHLYILDPWYDYPTLNNNIQTYYSFNNGTVSGTTVSDMTNNGNDGTISSSVLVNHAGLINDSLTFNKTTVDETNLTDGATTTGDFTIALWFRTSSTGEMILVDDLGAGYEYWRFQSGTGKIENPFGATDISTNSYNDNSWHLFVNTYDDTSKDNNLSLDNGTELLSITNDMTPSSNWFFGNRQDGAQRYDGFIDEIGIWNRVLTQQEIGYLWNNGSGITFDNTTIFGNIAIDPDPAYYNSSLNCTSLVLANNTSGNFTWTKNGGEIHTYDTYFLNITNNTIISGDLVTETLTAGDNWTCIISGSSGDQNSTSQLTRNITSASPYWNQEFNNKTVFITEGVYLDYNCIDPDPAETLIYNITNTTGNLHTPLTINSSTGIINYSLALTDVGNYLYNVTCTDNTNIINLPLNLTVNQNVLYTKSASQSDAGEGEQVSFYLNLNISNTTTVPTNVNLLLNGTAYPYTNLDSSSNGGISYYNYTADITLPSNIGSIAGTNLPWNWTFTMSPYTFITNSTNLTVYSMDIDNCTTYTNQILKFTIVDEETKSSASLINATVETFINISSQYDNNITWIYNTTQNSPLSICVPIKAINNTNYNLGAVTKYYSYQHAIEYYTIANLNITKDYQDNITLYDLLSDDSTDFKLTFIGSDYQPVESALVYLEREYVGDGIFRTVELPETDSNGQTVLHMVRNDVKYNIRIVKNNTVLGSFTNLRAFCADYTIGDCTIDLNAIESTEQIFDYNDEIGITYTQPTYDNSTSKVSFTFTSLDGNSKTVNLQVVGSDIFGNRTLCQNSLTASSGTLYCILSSNVTEGTVGTFISVDGSQIAYNTVTVNKTDYGTAGYLMFFIMLLAFILMFSNSKTLLLIGIILAFVGGAGLGILSSSLIGKGASLLWLLVIVLMGLWKLNRERQQ